MFPYIEQPVLHLGPLTLHGFGLLVGIGFLVGLWMVTGRAERRGLDPFVTRNLVFWMVGVGFVVSHWVSVLYSRPGAVMEHPFLLLKIWDGIASMGGLFGGVLAGVWFLKRRGLSGSALWAYLDLIGFVFPFAWAFGRAGCSLAHDHPGIQTAHWLAVRYPEGPRFDLGLLEFFYSVLLAGLFVILDRRRWPAGFYFGLFFLLYGPVRFFLDFLRVREVRYAGLTSGQFGSLVATALGLGVLLLVCRWRRR